MDHEPHAAPRTPAIPVDPRLYMAAERTLLAWIRTGLALMAFGFVIARVEVVRVHITSNPNVTSGVPALSLWLGLIFVATGAAILVGAAFRHRVAVQALEANRFTSVAKSGLAFRLALLLAAVGVILAVYLVIH